MMLFILLAGAFCGQTHLSVHLATSDPSELPPEGPRPQFTSCTECEEVNYVVAGRAGKDRIAPTPILQIRGSEVTESRIYVETDLLHPEKLNYLLHLFPSEDLLKKVKFLIDNHRNDRFVIFSCSEVTSDGWITPHWKQSIWGGVFDSENEARKLAARLGLEPKLIPYDREKDETSRVEYLRSWLSEFAARPNSRERIAEEEPDLFQFLQKHPKYWKLLEEEKKLIRTP